MRHVFRVGGVIIAVPITAAVLYFSGAMLGWYGEDQDLMSVEPEPNPLQTTYTQQSHKVDSELKNLSNNASAKQILFGDFHVHTTFSMDAFQNSLPIMQGNGVHPPSDACDFARYCSALDFYSINDHAESLTPERWDETVNSIQQCNAVAGDPANPDMVAFLGWEWTNIGQTPDNHYGHKNVVLRDYKEGEIPRRPIAARGKAFDAMQDASVGALKVLGPLLDWENRQQIYNIDKFVKDTQKYSVCPEGVHVKDLPKNCFELAATPAQLYEKLKQWDFPAVVIPHGTAWGNTAPIDVSWNQQLSNGNHDPELQTAIEVFSGHGNSEEYRPWRNGILNDNGDYSCPEPTDNFKPECWRAGEIIKQRCLDEGTDIQECERREIAARFNSVNAGKAGFKTLGASTADEWQDAGICKDCYLPTYGHRTGMSVQAALAIRNFEKGEGEEERFKFGFIGSSDNHTGQAGNGYKEVDRINFTDTHGPKSEWLGRWMKRESKEPLSESKAFPKGKYFRGANKERANSFMFTGGLVAVHSEGRDREAIWDAVKRNEVYSTSGPRIMLWFELLNGPNSDSENSDGTYAMGQSLEMKEKPRFRVEALGAFKQKPGCPESTFNTLGSEEIDRLCRGECYNPSDERHNITRIEVVKITPQNDPNEPLHEVIHDVWKTLECPADGSGCSVEFEDENFDLAKRDSVYYVRAIQEPSPTINGGLLNCEYNEKGECIKVNSCYVDERTEGDCLGDSEHRAWSSPIFVDYAKK